MAYGKLHKPLILSGADERNRTADLLITNQLLYRLSYVGENGLKPIRLFIMSLNQMQDFFSPARLAETAARPDFFRVFSGLSGPDAAWLVAAVFHHAPRPVCLITPDQKAGDTFLEDLRFFLGDQADHARLLPAYHAGPHASLGLHGDTSARRIRCLYTMGDIDEPGIIVATPAAAFRRLLPPELLHRHSELVMAGEESDRDELIRHLTGTGYSRVSIVEESGEFSVRGGILDVFSPLYPDPLRLEFFGDMVESLRFFDPATQRSRHETAEAVLPPAREVSLFPSETALFLNRVRRFAAESGLPPNAVRSLAEKIREQGLFAGAEHLLPFMVERTAVLTEYLPESTLFLVYEPDQVRAGIRDLMTQMRTAHESGLKKGHISAPPDHLFLDWTEWEASTAGRPRADLRLLPMAAADGAAAPSAHDTPVHQAFSVGNTAELNTALRHPPDMNAPLAPLLDWISERRKQRSLTLLVCRSASGAEQLSGMLKPHGIDLPLLPGMMDPHRAGTGVFIVEGTVSGGFIWEQAGIAVLTDREIFGRRTRRKVRKSGKPAEILRFEDMKTGDLVVHDDHGIGRYEGLNKMSVEGAEQDFLLISYRGGDRLYLPVDRMAVLQKYMGVDGMAAVLDKMGGSSWAKVKARVRKSAEKIAGELLRIYAERRVREGLEFHLPESEMERFEAGFPFEETPDQAKAIEDVRDDMARSRPMDRLICGDVGYGKTEIALRAAFTAAACGRQAVLLAPTTVLAEQHMETFSARFKGFPFVIACLNRFRSAGEQKEILKGMAEGSVDIVIGTHRLLQKDVKPARLGLIIVDEEQRFGVRHKEKLKQLRTTCDVLALTATPIPRTLHMSLTGIRDISLIRTPPEERRPIITYLCEPEDGIIADAIRRELGRNGQVFYIHNHIRTISRAAQRIQALSPEARVDIAHARMSEDELENTMLRFSRREVDVLVCTTIVESGLDVTRANTILIHRADRLGLAQIYQLRGRVGRGEEQAYAYLLIPPDAAITADARKRLKVLMEHSGLGSGFQIAMSDLQIRGGGALLGASQSGHIAAVGYDMFLKLMEEAIGRIRGEPVPEDLVPEIHIPVSAYLPESYIPDIDQRMTAYRRLSGMTTLSEISDFKAELTDRFGLPPRPAAHLFVKIMLKALAARAGVRRLDLAGDKLVLAFSEAHRRNPFGIAELVSAAPARYHLTPDGVLRADLAGMGHPTAAAKNILKEVIRYGNI